MPRRAGWSAEAQPRLRDRWDRWFAVTTSGGFPGRHGAGLQGVPGLLVPDPERTEIDVHLDLELIPEIGGHSPRVPAGATSAIRE